ncbi:MAG: Gfo/Idh/MocA family oxidoreductase [Firmicutes bacterium]|nr:Gfo/Idh/MocA family oxidoreductase [Bacillota bacterium]
MRLALVGCGGVGRAFIKLLEDKQNALKARGLFLRLTHTIDVENSADYDKMLARHKADMLVLATPTDKESGEPGYSYIKAAFKHGMHVVTADKGPILLAYHELKKMAENNGVKLGIGCTTGGALPAINAGEMALAGADILSIEGILNGASNFILEEMREQHKSFNEALAEAQRLGIAETDPSLDVEGWDTAIKLLILTNVLLNENKRLADVEVRGITGLNRYDLNQATHAGLRYKLVGRSAYVNNRLLMKVEPLVFGPQHPYYHVEGKNKVVRYTTDTLGELTISGGASGVFAAAASLLRDIINIALCFSDKP